MLTVLLSLIPQILALLKGRTDKDVDIKKLEVELEKLFTEKGMAELQAYVNLAIEQAKVNQILAQTGKLGWRDWLAKGLTIVFLFLLAQIVLGLTYVIWGSAFHLDVLVVTTALDKIPEGLLKFIWDALVFLLGGLYIARGVEKTALVKTTANSTFSAKVFFNSLRASIGRPLTQDEVDNFNRAIQAALKG